MDLHFLRKAWEIARKPDVCGRPWHVQLEVTTHCNLACYMCVRHEAIKHPRHLAYEDFIRTFDRIRPRKVALSGAGEPLLHPHIFRMIAYARARGAAVQIPSNGTLLCRPGVARGIVESGLNMLKISIDAATAQTYEAIRRQDCFDMIVEGIRQVSEFRKERRSRLPELRFDVVILKENYAEIPDIVRLARDLDVGVVFFRAVQTKGTGKEREAVIGKDVDFDALHRAVRQGIAEATHLGVRTNLKDIARNFATYRSLYLRQDAALPDQVCLLPWLQCFISVGGELSPCCATYTNEGLSAGNVFEQDFETVWNGAKMQAIRRRFKDGRNPFAICRDCIPHSLPVLLKMGSLLPGFVFKRVRGQAGPPAESAGDSQRSNL
jgi:MoaA/NifB/PqqE/SkfB family radical SAM enzyme